jgi:serine/threonine protein kinase
LWGFVIGGGFSMAVVQSDRNLLFGILALQLDFISREALLGAMNEWLLTKGSTLGDLLMKRGDLQHGERDALEVVVDRHVARHDGDVSRSLGAPASQALLRDVLQHAPAGEIQTALTQGMGDTPQNDFFATEPGTSVVPASSVLRFKVLRTHASGGLGDVFVALDQELNREVALKQIKPRYADDACSRERFMFEAKITGKLEHPGVVPMYGLGVYPDGRPYYAMQFINQGSLQDEIRRCYAAETIAEGRSQLTLRNLLGRFISVCNTLEFAHDRGILHRDIKPANIMLGKFGETFVVDWGLAKQYEPGASDRTLVNEPSIPSNVSASHTLEGQAVGTAPYMSTEQAAGKVASLTPSTDVYSLGATLYVLITNQVPFANPGNPPQTPPVGEILRRKPLGDFVRPRVFNPQCPKALEAICLKAMALEPGDRYASAAELAQDLERYLADEPVVAHQESALERAARWTRKHRTFARAAAISLILITATALIAVLFINSARRAEAVARENATNNYRLARQSVDTLLRAVSEELESVSGVQHLRNRLLEEAADAYQWFVREQAEDPQLRMEAAWSQHQLAFVRKQLGRLDLALKQYEQAAEQFTVLLDSPLHDEAQHGLASTKTEWGRIVSDRGGSTARARELHEQSRQLFDQLVESDRVPRYVLGRAKTLINLGVVQIDQALFRRAAETFERAIADLETLSRGRSQDDEHRLEAAFNLTRAYNNLGVVKQELGQAADAETAYRSAHAEALRLLKVRPESPRYVNELILAQTNIASIQSESETPSPRSIDVLERTLEESRKLVRDNPGVPAFRAALANSATGLAIAQSKQTEHDAARRTIDYALEQAIELLRSGDLPVYRSIAAKANYVSAQQYADTRLFERAAADFVRAIEHWKEAIDRDPAKEEYRVWLLYSYQGRIEMLLQRNDYHGAVDAIEEYAQHWPAAQRADYSLTGGIYMVQAAWSAAKARDILFAVQRFRQALQLLDAAIDQPTQ